MYYNSSCSLLQAFLEICEKSFQRGSTLSVKALELCQLPEGEPTHLQGQQQRKGKLQLALPLGELSSAARLRGHARVPTPFFLRFCYPVNTRKKVPPIKTVIYLDVLLLTNFALTLLFLLAAGLLAGVECRAGRLLLGGAAGAASSLALLALEAPDAAALLYKVSTAALTVAAAYGWPGSRCFARLVGWFCAGICCWRGAAPARGPDQQRLHLPAPLAGGTAGGRGRGGAGRTGSAPLSGPGRRAGVPRPAHRGRHSAGCPGLLRHRLFGAGAAFGQDGGAGAVRCRAGPPAARPGYLSGAALCRGRSPARPGAGGASCSPAPPWPGTVSCLPSWPACAAPAPLPGRAGPSTSMPPSPTSPAA